MNQEVFKKAQEIQEQLEFSKDVALIAESALKAQYKMIKAGYIE